MTSSNRTFFPFPFICSYTIPTSRPTLSLFSSTGCFRQMCVVFISPSFEILYQNNLCPWLEMHISGPHHKQLNQNLQVITSPLQHYWEFELDNSLLWGCPVHLRMISNIPGLYPLDASSTATVTTIRNVSGFCQMSPRGKLPFLENDCPGGTIHNSAILISSPRDSANQASLGNLLFCGCWAVYKSNWSLKFPVW